MTTTDTIQPELKTTLRRLKLGRLLDTLPDRLFALPYGAARHTLDPSGDVSGIRA